MNSSQKLSKIKSLVSFDLTNTKRVLYSLLVCLALLKFIDLLFLYANSRKYILPRFNVSLLPYHDPRFTNRTDLLLSEYHEPPKVVFTGDSRVKNGINPGILAQEIDVASKSLFNFGTGHQTVGFTSEVLLPHLYDIDRLPEYLVIGITPDYMLDRFEGLISAYRSSSAYQYAELHYDSRQLGLYKETDGVFVSELIDSIFTKMYALYRYRHDFVRYELEPTTKCILFGSCYSFVGRQLTYREMEKRESILSSSGWNPQALDGIITERFNGTFKASQRFNQNDIFNNDGFERLYSVANKYDVNLVFVEMPFHPSFWEGHEPSISRLYAEFYASSAFRGIPVVKPMQSYQEAHYYTDSHHLSISGANLFSKDIAHSIKDILD